MAKENVTTIGWKDILTRTEKNQGISKKTIDESFKAVDSEIKTIMKEDRPKKENDVLIIKTPITALCQKFIPEHIETDSKGNKYEVSKCIGVAAMLPKDYVTISNEGFELSKKKIEDTPAK